MVGDFTHEIVLNIDFTLGLLVLVLLVDEVVDQVERRDYFFLSGPCSCCLLLNSFLVFCLS